MIDYIILNILIGKGIPGSGFKGHPLCEFCNIRLYDEKALYEHMKGKHFSCGICDSFAEHMKYQYYENYESLGRF